MFGRAGDAGDRDAEGREAGLDGGSDGAVADDEYGFAGEVFAEDAVLADVGAGLAEEVIFDGGLSSPLVAELEVSVKGKALEGGEDGCDGPLGGGDVVDSATVAEGDVRGEPRSYPVDAGHEGLDDFDSAKVGEGFGGVAAREDEEPEVDVEGGGGLARDTDDLNFRRKAGQEFGRELFIDTNTHHVSSVDNVRRIGWGFSILACGSR